MRSFNIPESLQIYMVYMQMIRMFHVWLPQLLEFWDFLLAIWILTEITLLRDNQKK